MHAAPPRTSRFVVAALVGGAWGAYASYHFGHAHIQAGDFSQVWLAARAVLAGREPYAAVLAAERAGGFANDLGFYYPLPAALVGLPLANLAPETAAPVFIALTFALGAFAATRESWIPIAAFLGPSAYMTARLGQWGGLLIAALFLPRALGWLTALKPTVGAAVWVSRPTRAALVSGAALTLLSVIVSPSWVPHWIETVRGSPFSRLIVATAWFAPLLLLAGLRWRTREARLVFMLACIPHTPFWYDEMLLAAVPRTWRESFYTTSLAWLGFLFYFGADIRAAPNEPLTLWSGVPWLLVSVYFPALFLVLRRPNVGSAPMALERAIRRLRVPRWLLGTPGPSGATADPLEAAPTHRL